jgi:hypothetical protein
MIGILSFISSIFKPAVDLIDNLHTSDEEAAQLKNQFIQIQNQFAAKVLEYETKLMESRVSIIKAEATGKSWLQRNWRPITMLGFLTLCICDGFGIAEVKLAEEMWGLMKIGLGGYVVGRSAEKIVPSIAQTLNRKGIKE